MGFKSDIEIAQEAKPQDIREIAKKLDLGEDDIELYGKYKAKVDYNLLKRGNGGKKSKLILTTAINFPPRVTFILFGIFHCMRCPLST